VWDERTGIATRRGLAATSLIALVLFAVAWVWGDAVVARHGAEWAASFKTFPMPAIAVFRYSLVLFYFFYLGLFITGVWRTLFTLVEQAGIYFVGQLLVSMTTVQLLKRAFGRPRPFLDEVAWQPLSGEAAFHSFPSGHSADAALGLAVLLCRPAPIWLRVVAGLLFSLTVVDRLIEDKHYATDVVAGTYLGFVGAILVAMAAKRWLWRSSPDASDDSST